MIRTLLSLSLALYAAGIAGAGEPWAELPLVPSPEIPAVGELGRPLPEVLLEIPDLQPLPLYHDITAAVESRLADGPPEPIVLMQGSSGAASGGGGGAAGGSGGGGGDLASKSQNPVSDLVSLPLQSNWDFGLDPENRTRYIGNLQPVIPIKLNDNWNLINRFIVPFVNLPAGPDVREHGIGDTIGQFYFSPRTKSPLIWGAGPAVQFPTASDPTLGTQQWAVGVNGVALLSEGPIVAGALIYQLWGADGSTKPFLVQPFFNYNLPEGWFLNVSGEASADWERTDDSRWSFPLGAGVGRVFPVFGQPLNVLARFAPYLEGPPGGPDWQFRLAVTLLFPK